jgi:hypothetical protein
VRHMLPGNPVVGDGMALLRFSTAASMLISANAVSREFQAGGTSTRLYGQVNCSCFGDDPAGTTPDVSYGANHRGRESRRRIYALGIMVRGDVRPISVWATSSSPSEAPC